MFFSQNFHHSFLCNSERKNDLRLYLTSKRLSTHHYVGTFQVLLCVTNRNDIAHLVNHLTFQIDNTTDDAD